MAVGLRRSMVGVFWSVGWGVGRGLGVGDVGVSSLGKRFRQA